MIYNPQEIEILELLPQRPPFVMVDRLVEYDEVVARSEFLVRDDNLFCVDAFLSEYGVVENIAQTCAARIGYRNFIQNISINIGFIGAIKNLQILGRASVGQLLETRIEVLSEVFAITLISATVHCQGEVIANCEMKISLTDIEK